MTSTGVFQIAGKKVMVVRRVYNIIDIIGIASREPLPLQSSGIPLALKWEGIVLGIEFQETAK
ncbi:MAG: hypothetical protein RR891_12815 [Clostridium sp.]